MGRAAPEDLGKVCWTPVEEESTDSNPDSLCPPPTLFRGRAVSTKLPSGASEPWH